MMSITYKTIMLDAPAVDERLPGDMSRREYDLVLKAYENCITTLYPVSVPWLWSISAEYIRLSALEIAENIALTHLGDPYEYNIKSEEDAQDTLSSVLSEFCDYADHRNYQWYISNALVHAGYCYMDSDLDCTSASCGLRNPLECEITCGLEFVVINSPQGNLVPIRGGVHVCERYIRDPLMNNDLYHKYTTHFVVGKSQNCLQEFMEEPLDFEYEMFDVFDRIVKGRYLP